MRRFVLLSIFPVLLAAAPEPGGDAAATFATLRLSSQIARAGIDRHDPLLLLAAARLRQGVTVTRDKDAPDRAAEWIARAEAIGGDDPRVASFAADLRAAATKGRASGPRVSQALLRGGERRTMREMFRAGHPAVVYIEGDGDTDLQLTVGSACSDLGPGDVKICAWTPVRSEQVRIEINNAGRVQNRVILGTN